jgi:hypothetical protein
MRVRVIAEGLGASAGVKLKRVVLTRNPCGRAAWEASHARCAAAEVKALEVEAIGKMWGGVFQKRGCLQPQNLLK